jgi:hypothetical protein
VFSGLDGNPSKYQLGPTLLNLGAHLRATAFSGQRQLPMQEPTSPEHWKVTASRPTSSRTFLNLLDICGLVLMGDHQGDGRCLMGCTSIITRRQNHARHEISRQQYHAGKMITPPQNLATRDSNVSLKRKWRDFVRRDYESAWYVCHGSSTCDIVSGVIL